MSKKQKDEKQEKLTIYEYEQKYTKKENAKGARLVLFLIAAAIGVFLFFCLPPFCSSYPFCSSVSPFYSSV